MFCNLPIVFCIWCYFFMFPIAIARTPFKEKFAIPRQPLLAPAAQGAIELLPPYNQSIATAGLEQVSHIWLIFQFHAVTANTEQQLQVRPPRLGGNQKIGVFASRSTHRPNGLGMSVVKLDKIEEGKLLVSGLDLLDGTPIIDIKPYVPYSDSLPQAYNHIAAEPPKPIQINWQETALKNAAEHGQRLNADVIALIEQVLAQDPKPAYQQPDPERVYGTVLWDLDVRWHYPAIGVITVLSVTC